MSVEEKSPAAIAEEFGERLKQARLNADMTQVEVAEHDPATERRCRLSRASAG